MLSLTHARSRGRAGRERRWENRPRESNVAKIEKKVRFTHEERKREKSITSVRARAQGRVLGESDQLTNGEKKGKQPGDGTPRTREQTDRRWDPRTFEAKEHTQPQGDEDLEQVTCESDAKLDKNHEHSSGMQESIEAEDVREEWRHFRG